jgi:myo-inositol-1(or 4)-monophosphatase
MIKAAEKASKVLIRDFGEVEKLQVSVKGPSDFVTNADKKAEKIIIEELSKSRKKFSILSEETGEIKNSDINNVWIIDPIDGTTNFLHGVPHFAISIALKSNNEIISGLIFDPIKNEMFYAEKNNGAYFNNKRMKVSKKKILEECLFATGGKKEIKSDLNTRKSGSAALDLAYVASGRLDGFFHNKINLWDVAAGALLVQEAGGIVNNLNQFEINKINIRASSTSINDQMLKSLQNF